MISLKLISKTDLNIISYSEFGDIINKLIDKLKNYEKKNNIKFDIVVPILRSGGVPGMIIAINLGITKILPVQFKYCYKPVKLIKLLSAPKILQDVGNNPNILIVENHTSTGDTAKAVIKIINKQFSKSLICYATVIREYQSPIDLEGVKGYFWGQLNDEEGVLSTKQQRLMNVREKILVYPWENPEVVIQEVNVLRI